MNGKFTRNSASEKSESSEKSEFKIQKDPNCKLMKNSEFKNVFLECIFRIKETSVGLG